MKPIIGIINRKEKSKSGNKILYTYEEISNKINKSNGIPIGINPDLQSIKLVNGIILQGGNEFDKNEIEIVKYAYENNIPLLGICLGMQIMGFATCASEYEIENHMKPNINNAHEVILKKESKIYKILKKEKITVNSRHNYQIKNTTLEITGISENNSIEVIEDKSKDFFIGIQWHPESLENIESKRLFDYFIEKASENGIKRNIKNNKR